MLFEILCWEAVMRLSLVIKLMLDFYSLTVVMLFGVSVRCSNPGFFPSYVLLFKSF